MDIEAQRILPCSDSPTSRETGDEHGRFMRLFLTHEMEILRSVMVYVPQRSDARDILQETAIALWKHFGQYDPSRPFVNWACGYARIEVRRFLRRVHRQAVLSEKALAAIESADSSFDAERERHLADCRAKLPPESRGILDGYYLEEESVEELARRHGRSVEAIYKTLQRVRRGLLECMERQATEARG